MLSLLVVYFFSILGVVVFQRWMVSQTKRVFRDKIAFILFYLITFASFCIALAITLVLFV